MAKFFINTGDGFEFASTEGEARQVATEAIEFWRRSAITDGEWSDEVCAVYWGEIRERAKEIVLESGEDQDKVDYKLQALK